MLKLYVNYLPLYFCQLYHKQMIDCMDPDSWTHDQDLVYIDAPHDNVCATLGPAAKTVLDIPLDSQILTYMIFMERIFKSINNFYRKSFN